MAKKKTVDTLVEDVEKLFTNISKGKELKMPKKKVAKLMVGLEEVLHQWATPRGQSSGLRMSNIGRPNRQLWYDVNTDATAEDIGPDVMFRFLYGHVVEELLLFFVDLAGHKVEMQQAEVDVCGLKGHIDSVIDGVVIDIKTASDFSFKKFKDGRLVENDPFGYLAQLAGYEQGLKKQGGGFLVANKSTGELCLFRPDDLELPNIETRINNVRKELKQDVPPARCHPIIDKGKGGNRGLHSSCKWCSHKVACNPKARVFRYATNDEFLTKVVVEPRVDEVTKEYYAR
jgi:hypothetical protein